MPDLASAAGVRTHYTDQGSGDAVGAACTAAISGGDAWQGGVEALVGATGLVPERRGHGHTPDVGGDYTYPGDGRRDDRLPRPGGRRAGPPRRVQRRRDRRAARRDRRARISCGRSCRSARTSTSTAWSLAFWRGGRAAIRTTRRWRACARRTRRCHRTAPITGRCCCARSSAWCMTGPTLTVEDLARISAPALVIAADDDLVDLRHTVTCTRRCRTPNWRSCRAPRTPSRRSGRPTCFGWWSVSAR